MKIYKLPFYGSVYRALMRIAHKYNWHYAPPLYPDRDMQLWCQWCGFRETYKWTKGIDGKFRWGYLDK